MIIKLLSSSQIQFQDWSNYFPVSTTTALFLPMQRNCKFFSTTMPISHDFFPKRIAREGGSRRIIFTKIVIAVKLWHKLQSTRFWIEFLKICRSEEIKWLFANEVLSNNEPFLPKYHFEKKNTVRSNNSHFLSNAALFLTLFAVNLSCDKFINLLFDTSF